MLDVIGLQCVCSEICCNVNVFIVLAKFIVLEICNYVSDIPYNLKRGLEFSPRTWYVLGISQAVSN